MSLSDRIAAVEIEIAELKSQLPTEGNHDIIHARITANTNLLIELMRQNFPIGKKYSVLSIY